MKNNPTSTYLLPWLLIPCFLLLARGQLFAQDQPLFTFGVIADVQYADRENHGTRHYRSSLYKLKDAVDVFNEQKVDFVVSLGDFINNNYASFDTLTAITRKLRMRLYHVTGNHDFSVEEINKDSVLQALQLKNSYYTFGQKGWRFIVLNGNDISLIAHAKGSSKHEKATEILHGLREAKAPNAKPWNGTLSSEQLDWLKMALSRAEDNHQKVIIFCHFPLYPDGSPHILWNAPEIRNIIEAHPAVKAYMNGHVHKSQYFRHKNVHYITFRGMVEEEENAFAIISVFKDHLEIKGYGKEVDRILE